MEDCWHLCYYLCFSAAKIGNRFIPPPNYFSDILEICLNIIHTKDGQAQKVVIKIEK